MGASIKEMLRSLRPVMCQNQIPRLRWRRFFYPLQLHLRNLICQYDSRLLLGEPTNSLSPTHHIDRTWYLMIPDGAITHLFCFGHIIDRIPFLNQLFRYRHKLSCLPTLPGTILLPTNLCLQGMQNLERTILRNRPSQLRTLDMTPLTKTNKRISWKRRTHAFFNLPTQTSAPG